MWRVLATAPTTAASRSQSFLPVPAGNVTSSYLPATTESDPTKKKYESPSAANNTSVAADTERAEFESHSFHQSEHTMLGTDVMRIVDTRLLSVDRRNNNHRV